MEPDAKSVVEEDDARTPRSNAAGTLTGSVVEKDDIRPPPHYRPDGPPQVLTADTARQGPKGRRVLVVLVISLVAIGIAWALVAWFSHPG